MKHLQVLLLILGLLIIPGCMFAQSVITGNVSDSKGEPLIGASIVLKGTTSGVITDIDGNFTNEAGDNGILVISYVGYKPQEVAIAGKKSVNVILKEDTEVLDEVVVMAYTSTVKRKIVASVTNVDTKQIEQMAG